MDWFCRVNRDSLFPFPLFSCSLKHCSSRGAAGGQLDYRLASLLTTWMVQEVSPGSAPCPLPPASLPYSACPQLHTLHESKYISRDALFSTWQTGWEKGNNYPPWFAHCPGINIRVPLFPLKVSSLDNKLCANSMVTCILNVYPIKSGTGSFFIMKPPAQSHKKPSR